MMSVISLATLQRMKHKWGKEQYAKWCTKNEINGLTLMKARIWKPRGRRRGTGNGSCLYVQ